MSTWNELLLEFNAIDLSIRGQWLTDQEVSAAKSIGLLRGDRNVLLYASAFLQKPHLPPSHIGVTHEDINGLMSVIHGMDWDKGLTLILHTPGGQTNAAESIVDYLRSKFEHIEVIVPTLAMSAGTMISLACDRIVMGRQSQLGPIDPQMVLGGKTVSARAVVEQFDLAKREIIGDSSTGVVGDLNAAHVWATILQSLGPSLLQEAQNSLDYSEAMVGRWLCAYMKKDAEDPVATGTRIARHFNDASTHKSHGRRIGRDEVRTQGVEVEDLEASQQLQEAVLTLYHLVTIGFENSPSAKLMISNSGQMWAKNFMTPEEAQLYAAAVESGRGVRAVPQPKGPPLRQSRPQRRRK